MGLEPGCLQPREHCPWPAAALGCQRAGGGAPGLPAQPPPWGLRGPREALSQGFLALPLGCLPRSASTFLASVPTLPHVSLKAFPGSSALEASWLLRLVGSH